MNIFVLHKDPTKSAEMLCNKHVVKMIVESLQILCNCFDQNLVSYKRTHYNHLCKEYTKRYNKIHKCEGIIKLLHIPDLKNQRSTPFIQAMPDQYKHKNSIKAYRNYYLNEKLHFCKWMSEKDIPHFIKNYLLINNINLKNYIR